ncbi:hypothetical protein evm_014361 [Chilo suppressalis]|nr:hypothetical protein evm_014361 [Chilo suppressalis]
MEPGRAAGLSYLAAKGSRTDGYPPIRSYHFNNYDWVNVIVRQRAGAAAGSDEERRACDDDMCSETSGAGRAWAAWGRASGRAPAGLHRRAAGRGGHADRARRGEAGRGRRAGRRPAEGPRAGAAVAQSAGRRVRAAGAGSPPAAPPPSLARVVYKGAVPMSRASRSCVVSARARARAAPCCSAACMRRGSASRRRARSLMGARCRTRARATTALYCAVLSPSASSPPPRAGCRPRAVQPHQVGHARTTLRIGKQMFYGREGRAGTVLLHAAVRSVFPLNAAHGLDDRNMYRNR